MNKKRLKYTARVNLRVRFVSPFGGFNLFVFGFEHYSFLSLHFHFGTHCGVASGENLVSLRLLFFLVRSRSSLSSFTIFTSKFIDPFLPCCFSTSTLFHFLLCMHCLSYDYPTQSLTDSIFC